MTLKLCMCWYRQLTARSVYCAHCHSVIIRYGTIPWGTCSNSGKNFAVQKKIVIIMAGAQPRTSCRSLLIQLQILPAPWQCILPLMSCIISTQEIFQIHLYTAVRQAISTNSIHQCQPITNSSVHSSKTSNKHQLHTPMPTDHKFICTQQ